MPSASPMVISNAELTSLFVSVDTAFKQIPYNTQGVAQQLSFMKLDSKGEGIKLPFSPVSNAEKEWKFGEPRKATKPEVFQVELTHTRYAPDDELVFLDTLHGDVFGILQDKMPGIIARAIGIMDRRLAAVMNDGSATLYDNRPFFDGAHPVNPNKPGGDKFSNVLTGTLLDETGLVKAFDLLNMVKGWDGRLLNLIGKRVVVVPNERLEVAARRVLQPAGLIAQAVGATAAASVSTALSNKAEVIPFYELNQYDSKSWYVFNIMDAVMRPYITSVVRAPEFHYAGTDPSEAIRVSHGAVQYGWDCYLECGPALPHLAIKVTEP